MENYDFEMPTPCQHCGEIFDLNDGFGSEKWYPNTVICEECYRKEEAEIEEYLEEQKKVWTNTEAKCDLCGHKWIAVHHIESERLECPRCHNMVIFD